MLLNPWDWMFAWDLEMNELVYGAIGLQNKYDKMIKKVYFSLLSC